MLRLCKCHFLLFILDLFSVNSGKPNIVTDVITRKYCQGADLALRHYVSDINISMHSACERLYKQPAVYINLYSFFHAIYYNEMF